MTWRISHLLLEFGKCKDGCVIPAHGGQRPRLQQELSDWQWKEDTTRDIVGWDQVVLPPWWGKGVCFSELDPVLGSQAGIFYEVSLPRGPHGGTKGVLQRSLWGGLLEAQRLGAGRSSSKQLAGADRGEALPASREQWPEVLKGRTPRNLQNYPVRKRSFNYPFATYRGKLNTRLLIL